MSLTLFWKSEAGTVTGVTYIVPSIEPRQKLLNSLIIGRIFCCTDPGLLSSNRDFCFDHSTIVSAVFAAMLKAYRLLQALGSRLVDFVALIFLHAAHGAIKKLAQA